MDDLHFFAWEITLGKTAALFANTFMYEEYIMRN